MTVQRMAHVGIVADDLAAATGFFAELGLALLAKAPVEGHRVDHIVGLEGVRTEVAMMQPGRQRTTRAREVPLAATPASDGMGSTGIEPVTSRV
jgi:catechol 2,3-dioxygenase-like lactoylglutathione lyase family enzyme